MTDLGTITLPKESPLFFLLYLSCVFLTQTILLFSQVLPQISLWYPTNQLLQFARVWAAPFRVIWAGDEILRLTSICCSDFAHQVLWWLLLC